MTLNILDEQVARSLISEINQTDVSERRKAEYAAYKIATGGQLEYITARIRELFPKSASSMRISNISLSGKVNSKLSKGYKEAPIRKLQMATDEANKAYADIVKMGGLNTAMQDFDEDFNRQRYALLWVNKLNEKITFHALKGFESFVVRDQDSKELIAVILNYPDSTQAASTDGDGIEQRIAESQRDTSATTRLYVMWTKEHHVTWAHTVTQGKDGASISLAMRQNPQNIDNINPLGVIPFVFKSKQSSVDLPFLNPITQQTIESNVLISDWITASSLQGFGLLKIQIQPEIQLTEVHTGHTTALTLPIVKSEPGGEPVTQPDAEYLNANPDLSGMKETVLSYIGMVLSEHGIEGGQKLTGDAQSFTSGLDRLIAHADVQDIISDNQAKYEEVEREVKEIVSAYESLEGRNHLEDKELSVVYPKPKVTISDKEKIDNIKALRDNGWITEVEALMMLDPNLTEELAIAKLDKIKEEKKAKINSFSFESNEVMEDGSEDNEEA